MTTILAETALLPEGWRDNVRVEIAAGRIASVTPDAVPEPEDLRCGPLLPAPCNLHSHAFQRAMAGLTEGRGPEGRDSFWTWRRLMFRFLDRLTPEDVEAITAFAQMEMLEAGYGSVAEFHYLHHAPGGAAYDNRAEMSERVAAAAATSGIGLTLLPVLYMQGGCDGRALEAGQIRFGNDLGGYAALLEGAEAALKPLADAQLGLSAHSLRAVPVEVAASLPEMRPDAPVHMHLAEQRAEVEEVEAAHGARPVTLALDRLPLDAQWCFIHCTQMTPQETENLAKSGAVAGLCPVTEASLGDGIFDGAAYLEAGGMLGLGTDSNIRISLADELRGLEYSQRLRDRARAVLATPDRSTGRRLFDAALAGGARAAGREAGLRPGARADLLALDPSTPDLAGRRGDRILDAFVFARGDAVRHVWSGGRHAVRDGRHVAHDLIAARYATTLARLLEAM